MPRLISAKVAARLWDGLNHCFESFVGFFALEGGGGAGSPISLVEEHRGMADPGLGGGG